MGIIFRWLLGFFMCFTGFAVSLGFLGELGRKEWGKMGFFFGGDNPFYLFWCLDEPDDTLGIIYLIIRSFKPFIVGVLFFILLLLASIFLKLD